MNTEALHEAALAGHVIWHKHTFERMLERFISRKEVIDALLYGEVIEDYADDRPFPSCLLIGGQGLQVLHVVVAFENATETC